MKPLAWQSWGGKGQAAKSGAAYQEPAPGDEHKRGKGQNINQTLVGSQGLSCLLGREPAGLRSMTAKLGPGLGSVRQSFKVGTREFEKL